MSESLQVTIVYELGEEGWVIASVPEVPGANSQGRTRELRFGGHPEVSESTDSEPLALVIDA
jgi:hypothetical protein